jgi:hypothetical protein
LTHSDHSFGVAFGNLSPFGRLWLISLDSGLTLTFADSKFGITNNFAIIVGKFPAIMTTCNAFLGNTENSESWDGLV